MFSKSKTGKELVSTTPGSRTISIVSGSAVIKGEICIEDDLRIDGNVDGDIHSEGKVVIGPEGKVKGKITGKAVEVHGKIFGDVAVSDIVILRASCYYEGHIIARNIEIEPGAKFFGNCQMEREGNKDTLEIDKVGSTNHIVSSTLVVDEMVKEDI